MDWPEKSTPEGTINLDEMDKDARKDKKGMAGFREGGEAIVQIGVWQIVGMGWRAERME